jgi:hypothetical protein
MSYTSQQLQICIFKKIIINSGSFLIARETSFTKAEDSLIRLSEALLPHVASSLFIVFPFPFKYQLLK